MARDFNGTTDYISFSLGTSGGTGALSTAALVKSSDFGALRAITALGLTGNPDFLVRVSPTGPFMNTYDSATGAGADGVATLSTGRWYLIGMSKASGTATPRFHIYDYSTFSWTHENGTSTNGDPSVSGGLVVGAFDTSSPANVWSGSIAAAAVWRTSLSDAAVEALTNNPMGSWLAAAPSACWRFDQASTSETVTDLTGNGSDQAAISGTTVSEDPFGPSAYTMNTVTRSGRVLT